MNFFNYILLAPCSSAEALLSDGKQRHVPRETSLLCLVADFVLSFPQILVTKHPFLSKNFRSNIIAFKRNFRPLGVASSMRSKNAIPPSAI
jgi:hypothetical protein